MTSRYEGFGMVLIEGLVNGLPLISYDILSGPNEIITDEVNGYLISPFNIDEMADRILYLIDNRQMRVSMSNNNIKKINKFKLENIVKEWETIFEEIY